jgi:hypothetical protein
MTFTQSDEAGHTYGAYRQSHHDQSYRAVLKRLMDASPDVHSTAEQRRIVEEFCAILHSAEGEPYREGTFQYCGTNEYRNMLRLYSRPRRMPRVVQPAEVAAVVEKIEQVVETRVQQRMDMIVPLLGKRLGDCEISECRAAVPEMQQRVQEFDRWARLLGAIGRTDRTGKVSDCFTESELKHLDDQKS